MARVLTTLPAIAVVFWTQTLDKPEEGFSVIYYIVLFIVLLIIDICEHSHGMCLWAFCTMVADPTLGATYMTLFSTLALIGIKWTATVSLWMVDLLSITKMITINEVNNGTSSITDSLNSFSSNVTTLNNTHVYQNLVKKVTVVDGVYIEAAICFLIGIVWFISFRKIIYKLQIWPKSVWRVNKTIDVINDGHDMYK
ncbi:Acetyl-coenzyme A transporter 1-like protein [Leptotrombidium deliense]|uniref:Acetyl-coenzyme A transporter 1-like protein n=1 Tax=Leptotrombidium deliense TaxID=299467 RepID=A0A443S6B3_9ACAR|nr:Acetyl-coenzyme A transporter 1-like protein [Leptotrombidium deliense]